MTELGPVPTVCASESGVRGRRWGRCWGRKGPGVIFRRRERQEKQIGTQANTSKVKQTHFVRVLERKWRL